MNGLRLRLRGSDAPGVRVDMSGIVPAAFISRDADAAARVMVRQGNRQVALGDLFDITVESHDLPVPALTLQGNLRGFDRLGWQMKEGALRVEGDAGDYLGCGMVAGEITASGRAGDFTA